MSVQEMFEQAEAHLQLAHGGVQPEGCGCDDAGVCKAMFTGED